MKEYIRIISRNSQLALWQANFVKQELNRYYPDLVSEVIGVTTRGDKILDKSLDKVGGKGLFIKELEHGLLNHTADIAVHSLKDLPARLDHVFTLAAVLKREEAADALIANNYTSLESMPANSVIGTSSARRVAILKQYYPHLVVKLLRGNIQTRLAKLDDGEYDAIILAVAGLKRLNLADRITQVLSVDKFLPAIGQGVIAIEVLSSRHDLIDYLQPLNDVDTSLAVMAERQLGEKLGANCSVPIAIYAQNIENDIALNARIWDTDRNYCCQSYLRMPKSSYQEVIDGCFEQLLIQGAKQIMKKYE